MPSGTRTVQQVIDELVSAAGVAAEKDDVDTVKSGDPTAEVTGVVVCFIATYEVVRQAAELGANLVITHEPTFYNHRDDVDWLREDAVYVTKRRLLDDAGIVVWRYHDQLHRAHPDRLVQGMVDVLGWRDRATRTHPVVVQMDPTPLSHVVTGIKDRLGAAWVRVAGAAELTCRRVALMPGAPGGRAQIHTLSHEGVDLLVCGEINEWETSEYVRDAAALGRAQAMIVLGHAHSEELGMRAVADWIATTLHELPVTFLHSGDALRVM